MKLDREQIIEVRTNTVSIFTLLRQQGRSYQEAEKNFKLNPDFINPNFMDGSVKLVVSQ